MEQQQKKGRRERAPEGGTITRMVVQKKDPDRVSVYLDGKFAFGCHADVVLRFGLRKGREITLEERIRIERADGVYRAKSRALHYLSHKPRTRRELSERLARADFEEEAVAAALDRMEELGYLDDAKYARDYASARLRSKGHGPKRIRYDLRRRGVARRHIDAALEDLYDPGATLEKARELARRRERRLRREEDLYKRKSKLYSYLARRGYSADVIRQITEEAAARWEEEAQA